jgi:hypothetical protein
MLCFSCLQPLFASGGLLHFDVRLYAVPVPVASIISTYIQYIMFMMYKTVRRVLSQFPPPAITHSRYIPLILHVRIQNNASPFYKIAAETARRTLNRNFIKLQRSPPGSVSLLHPLFQHASVVVEAVSVHTGTTIHHSQRHWFRLI